VTAKYQVGRRARELGEAMRKVELPVAGAGLARRAVTSGVAPADPAPTIPVTAGAQTGRGLGICGRALASGVV